MRTRLHVVCVAAALVLGVGCSSGRHVHGPHSAVRSLLAKGDYHGALRMLPEAMAESEREADAYGGYDGIYAGGDVVEVACWAHARRKFFDAKNTDAARGHAAMAWIAQLYKIEHEAKEFSAEDRRALRQEKSKPLLASFREWLETERPKVLPKSPMGMAISYALSNWEALERYTEDGDLDPDNNAAERAIRPVAIGRKNWLFCGSDNGGRTAAVLMSICASCKQHGVNTFAYIRDMLVRVSTESASRIRELLPDRWKAERDAATREAAAARAPSA